MEYNLPLDFVAANSKELCEALNTTSEISIRLNPAKPFNNNYTDSVDWCDQGRYLPQRPSFTLDPIHAAGGYYVQEASSMAVGAVVDKLLSGIERSVTVLDLCAAPGGKSTHISSVVGQRGVVIANEVIRQRAGILAQNVVRWGDGNTIVTSSDSSQLAVALTGKVDVLIVDAPCSGEGMFRKDPATRQEWSLKSVELCAARQRRILSDAKKMLAEGGYLIYSTCTFNANENEQNVEWLVQSGEFQLHRHYTESLGDGGQFGSHLYPGQVRGEGLFIAVLEFTGSNIAKKYRSKLKLKPSKYSKAELLEVEHGGKLYGYSEPMVSIVEELQSTRTQILMAGVEFGEEIRGKLKPSHNFALYSGAEDIFPRSELPLELGVEFMRKGVIPSGELSEGLQLITYGGLPIGFAKRIGARVNNMYPTSWRIVSL